MNSNKNLCERKKCLTCVKHFNITLGEKKLSVKTLKMSTDTKNLEFYQFMWTRQKKRVGLSHSSETT